MKNSIAKLRKSASVLIVLAMLLSVVSLSVSAVPEPPLSPGQHALGLIPEVPPPNILPVPRSSVASFPSLFDNSSYYPIPGNQGSLGSCTAWAVGYAYKSYQENVERGWGVSTSATQFSPSYIYNQINGGADNGSAISTAMNLIVQQGVCTLEDMPYTTNYLLQPTSAQRQAAAKYKGLSYDWVSMDTNSIKAQIQDTGGVVLGIPVYPDFDYINSNNEVYDVISGSSRGWHAICLVGWDDSKNAFKFINSWGTSWGLSGFGYISYDLIMGPYGIYGYSMVDSVDTVDVDVDIDYVVNSTWGNNQNVQITITNNGTETIRNWALNYDPCGVITNIWNAVVHSENIVKNAMYNSDIAPGNSVTLGYTLTEATGTPPNFSLCNFREAKNDGYTVTFIETQVWNGGFIGEIIITNTTDLPIMAWELDFDAVNFTIASTGQFVILDNTGNSYKITGTYNGNIPIPAYTSIPLQFTGIKTGTPSITNVALSEMVF